MYKKLILLMLCLPLILMLSLFSVSNNLTLSITIPVNKIEFFGDDVVYLDLDRDEKYLLNYTVYPTNAQNKSVYIQTEQIGSSQLAELEYVDGYIKANSCGKAKVYLTTVDGGFKDSFIIEVTSSKLQSITSKLEKETIYVGDSTKIITTFIPEDSVYTTLQYILDEESKHIVRVNANGVVTGLSKGIAQIKVQSKDFPELVQTVTLEVKNKDIIDIEKTEVFTWQKTGSINLSLDTDEKCEYFCNAYDEQHRLLSTEVIELNLDLSKINQNRIILNYSFVDEQFNETVILELAVKTSSGLVVAKTCTVSCINQIKASFDNEEVGEVFVTTDKEKPITSFQTFSILPVDADVEYEYELSNDNLAVTLDEVNHALYIVGYKVGVTNIKLTIYNKFNKDEYVVIDKDIIVKPRSININENAKSYGIENLFSFGKNNIDGTTSSHQLTISCGAEIGENFYNNISWSSSSTNAVIDELGNINLVGNIGSEIVEFNAIFSYKGVTLKTDTGFKIRCVYDGVNIYNYLDLYNATNQENPKPIILHSDIKEDFAKGVTNYYKEINSSYDTTFYKNIGKLEQAKIKVLIEFKNDVYGNGYTINAHNVAWNKNKANAQTKAVFEGPLNFVALSETGGMMQVKAQDNVCFAVYENVTISNIVLKSCDLEANKDKSYNLNDLTYAGTTLEVFGDNVNIKYSRISNGRTVVRAFGDILDSSKVIKLKIENSVLSGAREFLLRIGSNCFVDGTKENPAPYLPADEKKSFPAQKNYEALTESEKQVYDNAFIKTFVTVKNSVFKDTGIFAIGLDSHFSGKALASGKDISSLFNDWHDLAKTSYGAKLSFEGDVRMYNWKPLNQVDSSTLIEMPDNTMFPEIAFNVKEMVEQVSKQEKFKNIIYTDEKTSTKYVHAGIAFFGGGKNYSVFEDENFTSHTLHAYEISLADVDKALLEAAAGSESFYFLINDNDPTSQGFLPADQEAILASKDAYSNIYK